MIEEIVLKSTEATPLLELLYDRTYHDNIYSNVLGRESVDINRLNYALIHGTDRDENSSVWRKSHNNIIKNVGLKNSDVTYAAPLSTFLFADQHLFDRNNFYMFYDNDKLELIRYKNKILGNDFFRPKDGYTFKDAIICIARLEL